MHDEQTDILYGINPVTEALKASNRKCFRIVVDDGKVTPRLKDLIKLVKSKNAVVESLPKKEFKKRYQPYVHQGIIGYFSVKKNLELHELISNSLKKETCPTLMISDGIQDPHNLGAIIRSAAAMGIQGIILPKHRGAPLNETVAKCSSGAIEKLPVTSVSSLSNAIKKLKESGFWIVGIDPKGSTSCYDFKFEIPVALLIGSEGKGIRPLIKKNCDFILSIPMASSMNSLNASAAGAVIFYEALRQKINKKKPDEQ
ncbi:MAG: 23S rRNA (guanosine(2251)-2'-O)-methyltransferase RlmB [Nitrospina sp.]|jgi:23S rRNA (guanosine2251-2'-O)-methyltransferase|nr:23S rRNA (guanosine(2251)-2'-O)-methyltransferase RlmB [Nitrospina sp.]